MRRLYISESDQSFDAPVGYSVLSYKNGQIVQSDKSGDRSISSSGELFKSSGKVFPGQLAYLSQDGTINSPQNVIGDDNKADNIIGFIMNEADEGEDVFVLTKGIYNNFENDKNLITDARSILYLDLDGNLTNTVTPYIFGKVLNKNSVMVDISFIKSLLQTYGITPAFLNLSVSWDESSDELYFKWDSDDVISELRILKYYDKSGYNLNFRPISIEIEENLTSESSISISDYISEIEIGSILICEVVSSDIKRVAQFKFQLTGKSDSDSPVNYFGEAIRYDSKSNKGIFNDGGIDKVFIDIIILSNRSWYFGSRNSLPLRKLFSSSFVKFDDKLKYVEINSGIGLESDIKIYEDFTWNFVIVDKPKLSTYYGTIDLQGAIDSESISERIVYIDMSAATIENPSGYVDVQYEIVSLSFNISIDLTRTRFYIEFNSLGREDLIILLIENRTNEIAQINAIEKNIEEGGNENLKPR